MRRATSAACSRSGRATGVWRCSPREPRSRPAITRAPRASWLSGSPSSWSDPRSTCPPDFRALAYPRPFPEPVAAAAEAHGVDARLLYALMRQESRFDPRARSPVGAVGLLQIMPYTAATLAVSAGVGHIVTDAGIDEDALTDPRINIALAARLIADLSELFDELPPIVASYNAGEQRVARWWRAARLLREDFFVDSIPYRETRSFVRAGARELRGLPARRLRRQYPTARASARRRSRPAREHVRFGIEDDRVRRPLARAHHESVAARLEQGDRVGRQSVPLVDDPVRQPLVVEAGARRPPSCTFIPKSTTLRIVCSTVLMMVRPPGLPGHHHEPAILRHDRRRHARQHPLAGLRQIGRRADEAARRREAGRGVEVAHLVVQQEPGPPGRRFASRRTARGSWSGRRRCAPRPRPTRASSRGPPPATRTRPGRIPTRGRVRCRRAAGPHRTSTSGGRPASPD